MIASAEQLLLLLPQQKDDQILPFRSRIHIYVLGRNKPETLIPRPGSILAFKAAAVTAQKL